MANEKLDLSQVNGIDHKTAYAAYQQVKKSAQQDLQALSKRFPTAIDVTIGYLLIGTNDSIQSITHMNAMFGGELKGDYSIAATMRKNVETLHAMRNWQFQPQNLIFYLTGSEPD